MKRRCFALWVLTLAIAVGWPAGTVAESAPTQTDSYRIGIEDVLRIVVWGEPELSLNVKVRPDGKITVPLLNDVEVVGLNPQQVRRKIASALTEYVKEPNVTVIVEEINSFRVYFLGEVNQQGAIQLFSPTRALQAIAAAGGLTEFAKKEVTLLREVNGEETRIRIEYKRLLAGDSDAENPYLRPGDTVLCK